MPLSRKSFAHLGSMFSGGESSDKSKKPTESSKAASSASGNKALTELDKIVQTAREWNQEEHDLYHINPAGTYNKSTKLAAYLSHMARSLDPRYDSQVDSKIQTTELEGMTLRRFEAALKSYFQEDDKTDTLNEAQRKTRKEAWESFRGSYQQLELKFNPAHPWHTGMLDGDGPDSVDADEEIANLNTSLIKGLGI